jgi:hypothetical protein
MSKLLCSTIVLVFCLQASVIGQQFYFNENCQKAYQSCVSFRFDECNKILEQEKIQHKDNLIPVLIADIEDASKIFISEEKSMYDKLKVNKKIRESILQKGNKKSPWYLYSLAELNLHWASTRLKFEEYITAAIEVNRAYGMLKENEKLFPKFAPTHKSLGLMRAMVGTLPDQYQWLLKFIGVSGNFNEGVNEMKRFVTATENDSSLHCFSTEILLFSGIVEANFSNNPDNAVLFLDKLDKMAKLNPLLAYSYISIAQKTGQSNRIFSKINLNEFDKSYFQFYYLNLLYGEAKLCRGDLDADVQIKKFLTNFKGTNYIKNANQRLWWHSIIHDNNSDAKLFFEAINGYGSIVVDEDKFALDTYHKNQWPNKQLLKSRLLFDGGYYTRALQCIVDLDLNSLVRQDERVEFMYRLGRIHQRMDNNLQAIKSFENAIKFGAKLPEYYAASACYELGKIYETQKMYNLSLTYFEKSKTYKNHSYRTSLNQKAKAAINRVEAKMKSESKLKS